MLVLYNIQTFYFLFLQQFVRGKNLIHFIIPGQPRTDTLIIGFNLQSVDGSVNHLFQEELIVPITPTKSEDQLTIRVDDFC